MDQTRVQEDHIHAMAIVKLLLPWRERIASGFGTSHGNAKLELFDVMLVMLAGFFNPMVRSQRLIEALSSQAWIQQQTGTGRVPRSTLSDALKRFDPEALRPLILDLTRRVPTLKHRNPDLQAVTRQILAVDGSNFNLAGQVLWALQCRRGNTDRTQARLRLNLHLDVQRFAPVDCDISGQGDGSEPVAMQRRIQPQTIYVMDRNFLHFGLIRDIMAADSSFVLRLRKNTCMEADSTLPLTDKDQEHGVRCDQRVGLTGGKTPMRQLSAAPPPETLRCVTIWDQENQCELVLLTDLLDVPAFVVGALYKSRWQIELFFKWLKSYANFSHLVSKNPQGVTLQFYVAVIGTLLLHLSTGRRVSKYALFWLHSVACGQATWEEMQEGLSRSERERALEKARLLRKKAAAQIQA